MSRQNKEVKKNSEVVENFDADAIFCEIIAMLKDKLPDAGNSQRRACIEMGPLEKLVKRMFWSPVKSSFYLLTETGELLRFSERQIHAHLNTPYGVYLRTSMIEKLAIEEKLTAPVSNALKARCRSCLTNFIAYHASADNIEYVIDPFAAVPSLSVEKDQATITLPLVPFPVKGVYNKRIVADYKEHFKELDQVLGLLVAGRFASNRKKAFLWIQAESDWGKGFFINALSTIMASVELSVGEVTKAFQGAPFGKDASYFRHAIAVIFNEVKYIGPEIKQLEDSLTFAPKNKLTQTVPIYTKVFLSADGVDSLAGEHGVESQMANRFTYLTYSGTLDTREIFIKAGNAAYFNSVVSYVAEQLNRQIQWYISQGREMSEVVADRALIKFHKFYGIDRYYKRVTNEVGSIAEEFTDWIQQMALDKFFEHSDRLCFIKGAIIVKSPVKMYHVFAQKVGTKSEKATLMAVKNAVFLRIDSKGIRGHSIKMADNCYKTMKGLRVIFHKEL